MLKEFIQGLPKAELHVHIEGTLEPSLLLKLAQRNRIQLPYQSVSEIHRAYHFQDLQSFLDAYYLGMQVLITAEDFYELALSYCQKAIADKVCHAEIFFDPQPHLQRGVKFSTIMAGLTRALADVKCDYHFSSALILCFLRDLSVSSAEEILDLALPYKKHILAVGLDSAERHHPPKKFKSVFDRARRHGFLTVAHAGEEGPPAYIWEAIEILKVARIDHGVRCLEDEKLINYLVDKQMPLTVCPLSNIKLKVFASLDKHPLKKMLLRGLCVSVHSDDPAYFSGYINENYLQVSEHLKMSPDEIYQLAINSFTSSFISVAQKQNYIKQLDDYLNSH